MRGALLTLIGLSFSILPTFAQENLTSVSIIKGGECRVELAGADLGCTGAATYSNFKNGRELFNFPATEVATIGIAGPTLEPKSDGTATLSVDHIYVGQNLIQADGQCSIQIPPGERGNTSIECRSVLRDGRKLLARLSSDSEWKAIFGSLRRPGDVSAAADEDCSDLMKFRGFLTRAQAQCGYKFRSDSLLQKAKQCSIHTSQEKMEEITIEGMATFDRNEKERGHAKVCADVLKDFPDLFRK
jgi:hypothetical protein